MGCLREPSAGVALGFNGAAEIDMEHWYALYTKPHKERHVSSFLKSRGFETYLPTIQVKKNGKGKSKTKPFFSCYLFVRLNSASALPSVRWTPGLRRIVSFGREPAAVPDAAISLIRRHVAEMGELDYLSRFKSGDRVESVAEFGIWGHDGHFRGHFQGSYLSAEPSMKFGAL